MPTPQEVEALASAVWQMLDDMGSEGQSVCLAAKAQARIAYEPFRTPDDPVEMDLHYAESIVRNTREY